MSNALKWIIIILLLGGGAFLAYRYVMQEPTEDTTTEEDADDDSEIIVDIDNEDTEEDVTEEETVVEEPDTTPEEEAPVEEDEDVVVGDTLEGATAAENASIQSYTCGTASGVFTFEWTTSSSSGETPAASAGTSGTDIVVTFDSLASDRVAVLANASSLCGTRPVVSATQDGQKSMYYFKEYSSKQFELSSDAANNKVYLKITL
ncbi:MAG: hypothetical protein QY318_03140 [Candidatus Dojkabacteria bacterium]|nr:MAG: hypothetical protein QY318_03140 [Candidatus Dojkabacteria bacterium]